MKRRHFIQSTTAAAAGISTLAKAATAETKKPFRIHQWQRDGRNPILPPGGIPEDVGCCMNPFAIRQKDEYWLYYAGADKGGRRRICLATTPVDDLTAWKRHGALFDLGEKSTFDETWCVLPCVHRIGGKWHLYHTGRNSQSGQGLQSFSGIGLHTSDDLLNWKPHGNREPVLRGDGFERWPDNKGIAGGGRILDLTDEQGTLYRMHYTLATGKAHKSIAVNQEKHSVIAHSRDGITWTDKRLVLSARPEADYEDTATIALNVWRSGDEWRAIYGGIRAKDGAYTICEARSDDGLVWDRGAPGENLAIPHGPAAWESKMTTYPNVIEENGRLRLFYCGNGYGATGIGTAVAEPLASS